MRKYLIPMMALFLGLNNGWAAPLFSVTPNVTGPSQLVQGQQGTAIYQITNNTANNLTNIGLFKLSGGVSSVPNAGYQYCSFPLNLNSMSSCLLKINLNSNATAATVQGGPVVCYSNSRPVYCSQPLQVSQLNTQITPGPVSPSCQANISNFNYELTQVFDGSTGDPWGPQANALTLSPSNPNLAACVSVSNYAWEQKRVLAAAAFWISQKLNYCHHHVPDYYTVASDRGASSGGYCNPALDFMPGSTYYGQQARWNYSGTGDETINNWLNNNYMWYGMDCSNYSAFLYNFALNLSFSADTATQAGQSAAQVTAGLTPNQQTLGNLLNTSGSAGTLVCQNNNVDSNDALCQHSGGYISVFDSSGAYKPHLVTSAMLQNLNPGDLLFIAGSLETGAPTSAITHVVMWTGMTVGNGSNQIPASQIAPNELCLKDNQWVPQEGDWVITDSHYQGADYRIFSYCFYQENLWGVRRVIQTS